jgi:hypothetical protein
VAPKALDQNTGWKICSDSFGNYTLKYPTTWNELVPYKQGLTEFRSKDYAEDTSGFQIITSGYSLSVNVNADSQFKSYDDYKNYVQKNNQLPETNKLAREILVDNEKCLFYDNIQVAAYLSTCSMFHNGKTYDFTFKSVSKDNSLFKQILSAFKFTP